MRYRERIIALVALGLVASGACRVGYDEGAEPDDDRDSGGTSGAVGGTSGEGGEANGGASAIGGTAGDTSGGSGGGGSSTGGASGKSTGGASGTSSTGGASGKGGSTGTGGKSTGGTGTGGKATGGTSAGGAGNGGAGTGGGAGSGGCAPTHGGTEICDGLDNDCMNGVDDGVTCPATCRGLAFNGNGYMLCDGEANDYATASASCTTLGMHLVKIDSAAENAFIATTMFGGGNLAFIWLGGDDIATEASWHWQDGSLLWTGAASGMAPNGVYTNWYTGSPGGSNTDCLEMRDDAMWDDKQCTQGKRYVCELLY